MTPGKLDELEDAARHNSNLLVESVTLRDLIAAARLEAALREALEALRQRLAMAIAGPSDLSEQSFERRDAYEHVLALIDALLSEVPQ